jgi:two-component system chemotaxis response regulator CheY
MRIMVVDDSSTMRRIIINSLQRIGYVDYVEAGDGDEALERFNETIDCVITDWNMPNMSGLEFVRQLRQHEHGATVPIVMVTTRSVRDDIIEAAKAGVNNYIVKPFTPEVLREKLNQVLSSTHGAA